MYLEGVITRLDEETQAVLVHIDRATPNSAHLIDTDVSFAADGLTPMQGTSPEGTTTERDVHHSMTEQMSDDEKVRNAAAAAVYQRYGSSLSGEQSEVMIDQVYDVIQGDADMRARIIASMDQILSRET
jgi:hypothetical protein